MEYPRTCAVLEGAVNAGAFPGCCAAAGTSGGEFWVRGFGRLGGALDGPVTPRTLYDLASVTKVAATTTALMSLIRDGKLALSTPVRDLVPEFAGGSKDAVAIEHLLTHSSGLPAWRPFYQNQHGYREIIGAAAREPLEAEPGAREAYSDIGAILLGECAARAGGKPLAALCWERVFDPIGMRDACYCPPAADLERIAPTEEDAEFRRRLVHGEVHDENAFAMGGVSGNAGLFSTAGDLRFLAAEVLLAREGKSPLFPRELARRFTTRRNLVAGSTRALGWDTRSETGSSAGRRFSMESFGHTGFTGTSVWIDPERGIFAILLSNRVHPTRRNNKLAQVRPRFHDAIIEDQESRPG